MNFLAQHQSPANSQPRRRRRPSLIIPLAYCVAFVSTLLISSHATAQDFSRFAHTQTGHARLPCLLCHRREDNSPLPRLPGHTPCTGCHAQQLTNPASNICVICHTDARSGAVKPFPPLKSFNLVFDHARHTAGLRVACAACHKPTRRGAAYSIPAGSSAHETCYQCHQPRALVNGRDISSCNTCHHAGPYARTPELAQAYRVNFSHAKHGVRSRLSCASCHQVRASRPQRQQVTAPVPQEHNRRLRAQSCLTCHDGQRAFGGYDFASCKRCHTGRSFGF